MANIVRQTSDEGVIQRDKLAGAEVPNHVSSETQVVLRRAISESFVFAFRQVMLIATALALLSALSAWILVTN